jgi:nicotinamidase-related amidase
MSKRAIIVVDLQNDYFASGKLPLVGIDAAAANAARVIAAARASGDPVIHIRHEFARPDAPFFVAGSPGAQIHASVQPAEGETVIVKNYPNSFRETPLKQALDAKGIEDVVIVGAMSHMCIDATARAAADFGYKATVVHDACATRDLAFGGVNVPAAQVHAAYMAALASSYGTLVSTADYLPR